MIKNQSIEFIENFLAKSKEKALAVNPIITKVEAGLYKVSGSNGNFYEVRLGETEQHETFIACTCRAALQGNACYHAATAWETYKAEAKSETRKREHQAMDHAPLLKINGIGKFDKIGKFSV
jgi:hypothetical protein